MEKEESEVERERERGGGVDRYHMYIFLLSRTLFLSKVGTVGKCREGLMYG